MTTSPYVQAKRDVMYACKRVKGLDLEFRPDYWVVEFSKCGRGVLTSADSLTKVAGRVAFSRCESQNVSKVPFAGTTRNGRKLRVDDFRFPYSSHDNLESR